MTFIVIFLLIVVAILYGFGNASPAHLPQVSASARQTAADTIVVTYTGVPDAGSLVLVTATVTSSGGNVQAKSIGQERDGAPPGMGAILEFTGPYTGSDRVVVTSTFSDGQKHTVPDTVV